MRCSSAFGILFCLRVAVPSCGGSDETRANEVNVSRHGEAFSHHAGDNCVSCHRDGGEAKGWFTVSGTVYRADRDTPFPNTMVRPFGLPNGAGETLAVIEVDAKGNFFTTESLDFARGLYPGLYSDSGSKQKALVTIDGACSSCHGVAVERLFVE